MGVLRDFFEPRMLPPLMMAVSTGLIDLFPGYALGIFSGLLSTIPVLLFIYPQLLSLRGTIGGIFSGRLSTALHLGEMKPGLIGNTPEFYTLLSVVSTLYLIASLVVSGFTAFFSLVFFSLPTSTVFNLVMHVLATFSLTQLSTIPVVIAVSKISYRRGWDPDIITYPFTSSFGDLFITIYFLGVGVLIYFSGLIELPIILSIPLFILPFMMMRLGLEHDLYIKEMRESIVSLVLSGFIVVGTGYLLKSLERYIVNRPYIYFIYPALLTTIGDVGSIVGSSATTGLNMSGDPLHELRPITYLIILSIMIPVLFMLYTYLGGLLVGGSLGVDWEEVLKVGLAGLVATLMISGLSIMISFITFRRSLDPDHFVIPIESTSADLFTTLVLYIVLAGI